MFDSLKQPDPRHDKLDQCLTGSFFRTIEYEISDLVKKIENIDNIDEKEIRDIIIRQHQMILNYDLFLSTPETRSQTLKLFTNKKFLFILQDTIKVIQLSRHEIICLNKLAYDYYILPDKDQEISDLLYGSTIVVNLKQVTVLSGIYGLHNAQILAIIRNSTFTEQKAVHRVNTYLIRCNLDLTVDQIVSTYCYLFERFTDTFIYTMLEPRPSDLTEVQYKKYDNISLAILRMMDSLTSSDIQKLLLDYGFTLMNANVKSVRFSFKTIKAYPRITSQLNIIDLNYPEINIP